MGATLSSHRADRSVDVMGWEGRRLRFMYFIWGEDIRARKMGLDVKKLE